MGTCGCGGGQGLVVGGAGIAVAGAGTAGDPWAVSVKKDSVLCELVEDCAGAALCPGAGLSYDDAAGCLGVRLSTKAGNALRLGRDGGLWVGAQSNPVDSTCGATVDSLPDYAALPLFGAGRNAGIYGDRIAVQHALTAGADGVYMNVGVTAEGGVFVAANQTIGAYPFVPQTTGLDWRDLSADQARNVTVAWTPLQMPSDTRWPGVMVFDEFMKLTQGRIVPVLNVGTLTAEEDTAVIAQIQERCAERQVIILGPVGGSTRLAAYQAAGIDTGAFASGSSASAAELQGAGARWAWLPVSTPDDGVTPFVEAGLNTVLWGSARRYDFERGEQLGCRGFSTEDTAYQRPVTPFRMWYDPWCYDGAPTGQVHDEEVNGRFSGWAGGRFDDSTDTSIPSHLRSRCGWQFSTASTNRNKTRQAITLGWACPVPGFDEWPYGYNIDWAVRLLSAPGPTGGTGLIFASEDDRCPTLPDGSGLASSTTGYSALFLNATKGLQLRRLPSETGTPLGQTTPGTTRPVINKWYYFRLRVTPSTISFWEMQEGGIFPTEHKLEFVNDSTFRGGYIHLYKVNRFSSETTWTPMDAAYRQFRVTEFNPEG